MSNFNICEKEIPNLDSFIAAVASASVTIKLSETPQHNRGLTNENKPTVQAPNLGHIAVSHFNVGEV